MSTDDVKEQLKQQLRSEGGAAGEAPSLLARASHGEVATGLRGFSVLVSANFQVLKALRSLAKNSAHAGLANTFEQIASSVEQGTALSKAMARFPWYFDPICVAIVRASEESGTLDRGLGHIADMMEIEEEVRDKVASALAYPLVLISLGVIVMWVLLTFVVPNFVNQLHEAQQRMEGVGAVIEKLSDFVRSPIGAAAILGSVAFLVWSAARGLQRSGRSTTAVAGRLPIFRNLVRVATVTQFANMVGLLTSSGVTLTMALELARSAFAETHLANATRAMHQSVESGRSVAEAARASGSFDPMVTDMIAIGEESGRLGDTLSYVARMLRTDLLRKTGRIELLLQPVLLIVMGAMVLMIFLSFLVPYLEVLSKLSTQGRT